ncbi:hypothetical protein D9M72_472440 [compost metagenome]
MVDTASTGYSPEADSADSMTASAPSKTAVATSETSARVGTGAEIIDSSICVATTTGLPARRHARVSCFCRPGTDSSGISTPRSPRATISASESSMISSMRSSACGFSIFDIRPTRPRAILRTSARSSGRCTKESATQSISPVARTASRSARSLSVRTPTASSVSGKLTPLRSEIFVPATTVATMLLPSVFSARRCSLPSSINRRWPGLTASRISGCGRKTRVLSPGSSLLSRVKV